MLIVYLISVAILYFNCRYYYKNDEFTQPNWMDVLLIICPFFNTVIAATFTLDIGFRYLRKINVEKPLDKINNFMHKYFSEKLLYKIFLLKKQ